MKKLRSFTLVELMITITVIMILATFTVVSLNGARKTANDKKRISDVNLISSALDQYYLRNGRTYPNNTVQLGSTEFDVYAGGVNYHWVDAEKLNTNLMLLNYLSPFPKDPKTGTADFNYVYLFSTDGKKAAVVASRFEKDGECNIPGTLPAIVSRYTLRVDPSACYFVAK